LSLIRRIFQNPVFKITSINSVSVMIRIVTGLVSTSVVAKILGPSGVALLGNLRNFITSLEAFSTLGFNNGIVKYVAQYEKDEEKLTQVISTVFWSLLVASILLALPIFVFSDYWNERIFGESYDFGIVFQVTALSLPLFALNIFLVAVINGLSQFKKVILINIVGNIIGFVFSILMILKYKTLGALLSMGIVPALLFLVSWFWITKSLDLKKYVRKDFFDFSILKNLSSYSLMALVSAFSLPLVYLAIRTEAINLLGIDNAGNWEAMNRLASFYMMFISTLLSVYFFPKLSQSESNSQTRSVFGDYYKNVIPMFIVGGLVLYFSRGVLIELIYSDKFVVLSDLFVWQLVGDFFKVCSLILGYQFFAKKMTKAFIATQILSIAILYFSSHFSMKLYGTEGLVMAHAITYAIYFVVLLLMFRKTLFGKN
jgi:O-antigen/teichoic acid export membrane protein